jgi:hypothetical protein
MEERMMEDVLRRLLVVAGMAVCIRLLFMVGLTG